MRPDPSKPWFAPKRYGYGSGLPIAWQGWLVLAIYLVVCTGAPLVLAANITHPALLVPAVLGVIGVATLVLIVICANKTRGGWRWRWGGKP